MRTQVLNLPKENLELKQKAFQTVFTDYLLIFKKQNENLTDFLIRNIDINTILHLAELICRQNTKKFSFHHNRDTHHYVSMRKLNTKIRLGFNFCTLTKSTFSNEKNSTKQKNCHFKEVSEKLKSLKENFTDSF